MATECCSCLSQRGEDVDACPVPRTCVGSSCHVWCGGKTGAENENGTFYNNEISQCTASQVNESDSREFVAGTFVWSGFDYLGEARVILISGYAERDLAKKLDDDREVSFLPKPFSVRQLAERVKQQLGMRKEREAA